MREINRIFVHCSASEFGNALEIDRWHKQRGWSGIGYHAVVLNLFPTYAAYKDCVGVGPADGTIEPGRPDSEIGSHVYGANSDSLGICLVGNEAFSQSQIDSLIKWCVEKCVEYGIAPDKIRGHSEWWTDQGLPAKKSCPNIPVDEIRKAVRALIVG